MRACRREPKEVTETRGRGSVMEWQRGQSDALGRNPIFIGGHGSYRIPEAFKAFCIIVSFTAAKTSRIFVVSVACVRLQKG